jgi:hypothetical protein
MKTLVHLQIVIYTVFFNLEQYVTIKFEDNVHIHGEGS